ncbi:TetR/AcrR family transcriptional regulator [Sphingomonas oligophenolica]|uniref:TetR/AcrR family transcriptional regulator n=1 Tax=Sphingomonas oligophenolica TaxID=301154 RepID=A0ABU9XYC6_9SPHN
MRTRATLLATLLRLIETRPFDQVTIREIAQEAEIGYATFFRHYASKEALLDDLMAGEVAELVDRAWSVLLSADSGQSCVALFDYVAERRALWSALLTGGAAAMFRQEFIRQVKVIAEREGGVGGWLPDELRVFFAVNATVDILAWWLQRGTEISIERMAGILDRLVVAPAMAVE